MSVEKVNFETIALADLESMDVGERDALPFGVVGFDPATIVETYNATEARMSGLEPSTVVTLSDISQQVVQEERLRQADMWFATLLDGVNEYASLAITPDGRIASVNTCFTRQTGYDCASILGLNLADVLDSDGCGGGLRLDEQIEIAGRDGWHLQEGWQSRADGERYWCQRLVVAKSDGDTSEPTGFSVVLRDVPRGEAAAEDMRRLLTCDHLTGASNRRHFSHARQAIVAGVLQIAASLDVQCIAEGIETAAELRSLRELGVSLCQGYLLARPIAERLPSFVVPE